MPYVKAILLNSNDKFNYMLHADMGKTLQVLGTRFSYLCECSDASSAKLKPYVVITSGDSDDEIDEQ